MGKLLRLRDYIFLTAAALGDISEEIYEMTAVPASFLDNRYGYYPYRYQKRSYLSTVYRMLSTKDIRKVFDKNCKPYLVFASKGKKVFERQFPLISLKSKNGTVFS